MKNTMQHFSSIRTIYITLIYVRTCPISLPQRGRGTTAVVDEEIGVCITDKISVPSYIIKIGNFRPAEIHLLF